MTDKDLKLLASLYQIHAPSGHERKIARFVSTYAKQAGATVTRDKEGNVYATKGNSKTYPCLVAHLDQVQRDHAKDFKVMEQDGVLFGFSATHKKQQGLGADDKNGIWIALTLLRDLDACKAAFFVSEEVGCVGSLNADMDFFNDCRFVLQGDRKGGGDLITSIEGMTLCSDEFLSSIPFERFGYATASGLMTDVQELCHNGLAVSCINYSVGYHNPHTDYETTVKDELYNARELARWICLNLADTYPCEHYFAWKYETWYDDYDDCGGYDIDTDTMRFLLDENRHLTFETLWSNHRDWFYQDKEKVRRIYDNVVSLR